MGPLELRLAELQHHIKIESAVVEGAKNVVKQLSGRKIQDRRIFAEVGNNLWFRRHHSESASKIPRGGPVDTCLIVLN